MPINKMPPYIDCKHGDLSVTEELSRKGLNLPSSVGLKMEEIEKVYEIIINNQRRPFYLLIDTAKILATPRFPSPCVLVSNESSGRS